MTGPLETTAQFQTSGEAGELMPTVRSLPMLLTVKDVEVELQLGRTRTYEMVRSGELPVVRIGRAVRIPRRALERWVEIHAAGPAEHLATNQPIARL